MGSMSLTDPTIARAKRQSRDPARARPLRVVALWLPLTAIADSAVIFVVFGTTFGTLRYMVLSGIAQMDAPSEVWQVFALVFGIPGAILLGLALIAELRHLSGWIPAILLRFALFTGLGAALSPYYLQIWPEVPGSPPGPWLAVVFGVLTLGLLALAFAARRRSPVEGTVTATGTVTAVEVLGVKRTPLTREITESMVRVTASFADEQGRTRFAEKSGFVRASDEPAVGDAVAVTFDPRRPSNRRALALDVAWSRASR